MIPGIEAGEYYNTGDLAYYDETGRIIFVGRKDYQIKHMGHRIELSHIENVVEQIDGVKDCICVYVKRDR